MRLSILIVLIAFLAPLHAQETELTLQQCLDLAYENNLELLRGSNAVRTAETNLKESKFSRLPNLNFSSGASIFSGRVVDPTTNDFITESFISNDLSFNSNVMLYNGGRINQQIAAAKLDEQIAQKNLEAARDNVGLLVINTFLNVVLAQENLVNQENLKAITEDQYRRLRKQVTAGTRPRNDLLNLEVQLAQNDQSVVQSQNDLGLAKLQLLQLIRWEGSPNVTVVAPSVDAVNLTGLEAYSFDAVYAAALQTMPGIQVAELNQERAQKSTKIAKTGYYPSLTASALLNTRFSDAAVTPVFDNVWVPLPLRLNGQDVNVEIEQQVPVSFEDVSLVDQYDQNLGYGVGLNLNIPLFNRWSNKANVQRAKIQEDQAQLDTDIAKDNLKIDIQNALASARAARTNYDAALKTATLTEAVFENNSSAYDVGGVSIFELNQSQLNYDNAQRSVLTSKYNYIFRLKVLDFYLGRNLNF